MMGLMKKPASAPIQDKIISLRELVGDYSVREWRDGVLCHANVLLLLGEVRKSGALIYFRPGSNDFTCDGKTFFPSYAEAYKSENW